MNVAASTKPASDGQTTAADVEGALRGIVRREVASYRRQPESGEASVNETHSVIRRVSVTSVKEIDTLIAQLQQLRDFLQSEGERIEREITEYEQLGDAAMKSTKIIAENMALRKSAS